MNHKFVGYVPRPQIAEALVWVSVWVCGGIGLILGAFAVLAGWADLVPPALITLLVWAVGLVQRVRERPHPLLLLVVSAAGTALVVPFVEISGHLVILSMFVVLGSVGALALTRTTSMWFAAFCALLSVISLHWILPEAALLQEALTALLLVGVHFASWRFVSIAAELLLAEEQRTSIALDDNRRLLEFEQALASCSRSLLMGSGEEALEAALTSLRQAIDADRAYLAINLEDEELGPSFQVVKTATRPGCDVDDRIREIRAWSDYRTVAEVLETGQPFRHVATESPDEGWNRSILSIPVFTQGRWIATLGFLDIARQTVWDEEATRMLEVAAPMLGTFWEKERTRQHLEDLVKSKDRFVASVSHELRTPLAAVLGFAEELRVNASSFKADELAGMLELIADQSKEMADMVEDLLVSARADLGTVSIHPQDVYLRAQAETVLAGLSFFDGKVVEVIGGRGKVWADPSRTRQIIRNLITNAIRYGGRHVTIEAMEAAEHTTLTVIDDGSGLDPVYWETIFEPYERAHDIPTQPSSIGLGLTVARQLARMMGGDLVYHADPDGSVFTLTLPAAPPEEVTVAADSGMVVARG